MDCGNTGLAKKFIPDLSIALYGKTQRNSLADPILAIGGQCFLHPAAPAQTSMQMDLEDVTAQAANLSAGDAFSEVCRSSQDALTTSHVLGARHFKDT